MRGRTQQGRTILHVDIERAYGAAIPTARLATRTLLQQRLFGALGDVELVLSATAVDAQATTSGVTKTFADGTRRSSDLLVVADGIWSRIAERTLGTTARHCGYGGVIALSDAAPGARRLGETCEYWGRGERFALLDLGGERAYWFLMLDEAEASASAALTLGDVVARLAEWPREVQLAVEATPADRLIPFSIHAKPPPTRLGHGRIVCVAMRRMRWS